VLVAAAAVSAEILALVGGKVGFHEALVVAIDGAHLPRPGIDEAEIAGSRPGDLVALIVHELWLNAEEWLGRRARLEVDGAGQRRDENAAGFRLPPGVDDRAALLTHHAVVPLPCLRIDGLAHRSKNAQGFARGFLDEMVSRAHQRADGGGGGVEDVDLML